MASGSEFNTSVVAFEGHPEILSTQLRLLPASPHVLVLPEIRSYLSADAERDFDTHKYIKSVHDAVKIRDQSARDFLQWSTKSSKRLVFLNGGTPTAQTLCMKAIAKHQTDGDERKAEAIFDRLVKDGVAGLSSPIAESDQLLEQSPITQEVDTPDPNESTNAVNEQQETVNDKTAPLQTDGSSNNESMVTRSIVHEVEEIDVSLSHHEEHQDPITRAMQAADALDRQTESLQPSNDLDLTISSRPRSSSLPLYGIPENLGESTPFYVFGPQQREETDTAVEYEAAEAGPPMGYRPTFAVFHYEQSSDNTTYPGFFDQLSSPSSPVGTEERHAMIPLPTPRAFDVYTPFSDTFGLRSPENVVFGEASLLDVRKSGRKPSLARIRSLDRIYSKTSRLRDLCIPEEPSDGDSEIDSPSRQPRPQSCILVTNEKDQLMSRIDIIDGPRAIVVRPKNEALTVTVAPVPLERRRRRRMARACYIDRGTDAAEELEFASDVVPGPFEPTFPLTEDLIIYLRDESPDTLLDRCIHAFKDGKYPIVAPAITKQQAPESNEALPGTPESQFLRGTGKTQQNDAEDIGVGSAPDTDDYDPFAYVHPPKAHIKNPSLTPVVKVVSPPTPEQTPTPSVVEEEKFRNFEILSTHTTVAVQNSLRSLLGEYFPPEAQCYHQFFATALPELNAPWQPVFRDAEPQLLGNKGRNVDQILAIGSQKGVQPAFSSAITTQLEKIGSKASGVCCSGRLDFRYLLATAMQVFGAQHSATRTLENPFHNPHLLATLIMPHLEMYMALHSQVKFLIIEYPPEHLATVLALQRLVGVEIVKVAHVVDAKSKDISLRQLRGTSVSKYETGSLKKPPTKFSADLSVSKVNFLLTSMASDAEIAEFISMFWKLMSGISDFYTPEAPPPVRKSTLEKKRPPPLHSTFSPFPKVTEGPKSPRSPAPNMMTFPPPTPVVPVQPSRPVSIAETTRTVKTMRSRHSRATSRRRPTTRDGAMSVYTFDPAEDSDYDMEERRLMPLFLQKPKARKGNSRKALKFLGLA